MRVAVAAMAKDVKFKEVAEAEVNNRPKTALYLGCSDARLAPDAQPALLEATEHEAGYKEIVPGGCNVLAWYNDLPVMSPEAARVISHVYMLLVAADGAVRDILVTNHTNCARDNIEGDGDMSLEDSFKAAFVAATFMQEWFLLPRVQDDLRQHGYKQLVATAATFDVATGKWHAATDHRLSLLLK